MNEENGVRLAALTIGAVFGFAFGVTWEQEREPIWSEQELLGDISTQSLCEELISREGRFVKVEGEWQVDMDRLTETTPEEGGQAALVRSLRCLQTYDPWEFEQLQAVISSDTTE